MISDGFHGSWMQVPFTWDSDGGRRCSYEGTGGSHVGGTVMGLQSTECQEDPVVSKWDIWFLSTCFLATRL